MTLEIHREVYPFYLIYWPLSQFIWLECASQKVKRIFGGDVNNKNWEKLKNIDLLKIEWSFCFTCIQVIILRFLKSFENSKPLISLANRLGENGNIQGCCDLPGNWNVEGNPDLLSRPWKYHLIHSQWSTAVYLWW